MSELDIVRAWKDAEYRQSLSAEAQVLLSEYPAGSIALADEELPQVAAAGINSIILYICTQVYICTVTG